MKVVLQMGDIREAPVTHEGVSGVVVQLESGKPIMLASQQGEIVWIKTVDQDGFEETMRNMGFTRYVRDPVHELPAVKK